jgi:hypothetical protein
MRVSFLKMVSISCKVYLSWTLKRDSPPNKRCFIHFLMALGLRPRRSSSSGKERKVWRGSRAQLIPGAVLLPWVATWTNLAQDLVWGTPRSTRITSTKIRGSSSSKTLYRPIWITNLVLWAVRPLSWTKWWCSLGMLTRSLKTLETLQSQTHLIQTATLP